MLNTTFVKHEKLKSPSSGNGNYLENILEELDCLNTLGEVLINKIPLS